MITDIKLTKLELIELIADEQGHLPFNDVKDAVDCILEQMAEALEHGDRIEIRGFGAFSLHKRRAMMGRNPMTGERIPVPERYLPHFKAGKVLNNRLNKEVTINSQ